MLRAFFKNNGSRKDLNFYRGLFRINVFRSILDKHIYIDDFETIDKNLTDSNVGGRRGRNIRDNIFVLSAIINSIKMDQKKHVTKQFMTLKNVLMPSGSRNGYTHCMKMV